MVPLLRRAPLAQKELVRTSIGRTVLVSRSQRAPQAEWPLIWRGSSLAPNESGETLDISLHEQTRTVKHQD